MKFHSILGNLFRIVMFLCLPAFAQQIVSQTTDAETRKILEGIEAGDINALGAAAASGRQVFVPSMKEQLRDPKKKLHAEVALLQVGLAKAGEAQQLQQISCELNFGNSSDRLSAMRKVESVDGWFAISSMAEFLKDDSRYTSVFGGGMGPLQDYALQILPNLVPPPPPAPPQTQLLDHTKVIKVWHDYLDTHHDALSALAPIGEGVVTSKAICQQVLKQDPAAHRKPPRDSQKPRSGTEN